MKQQKKKNHCPENAQSRQKEKGHARKYESFGRRINMSKETIKLFLILLFFIFVWGITSLFNFTILWLVILCVISIYYIIKYKNIDKKDIAIACLFGMVSIPSNFIMGLVTIPTYLGAMCILKDSNNEVLVIKTDKKQMTISLGLGLGIGIVLGGINLLSADAPINFSVKLKWFLDAIRAGVTEEIIFRLFFFAICVAMVKDKKLSKTENILCYFIMILPHVLIHFNLTTVNVGSVIFLFLLFGLPFAVLQRKRDLVSAIVAHSVVDLIRFCVLGI